MQNKNSYTIVGLFFMACVAVFAVFMWWMSDSDKRKVFTEYYIITDELPSGLRVQSQVKFAGVFVGSVKDIEFEEGTDNIIITLRVEDDVPVKKDSLADVEQNLISGISMLNISRGKEDFVGKDRVIALNDTLMARLRDNAQNIGEKVNESLKKMDALFSDENIAHLQNTLKGVDSLVSGLGSEENLKNIGEMLVNLNKLSADINSTNVKELSENLNKLVVNANVLIGSTNGVIKSFGDTSKILNEKMASGEYDFKKTFEPVVNETNEFLGSFAKTLREVRNALKRLEDNPYEFFFKDTGDNR